MPKIYGNTTTTPIPLTLGFDYYYEFDSMTENYDEYITPGLYKIRHKQGGNVKIAVLLVRKFSSSGYFQMKFVSTNILTRKSYANEDGTISKNKYFGVNYITKTDKLERKKFKKSEEKND